MRRRVVVGFPNLLVYNIVHTLYILKNGSCKVSSKFAELRTMVLAKFAAFKLGKSCSGGVPPPLPHAATGLEALPLCK